MNTKDKTQNSIRNSAFGIASQIVIILISFFTRSIFLKYLSEEYLGLNGLFSNVISILSLTELGFGTAAIYALYKPLAAKEEEQVAALMNLGCTKQESARAVARAKSAGAKTIEEIIGLALRGM